MASNEYFKQNRKIYIVLLLNSLALFGVNDKFYADAEKICECYEEFADDFLARETQRYNYTNFIFSPFAMQNFEEMVVLGFNDKPEMLDENFSEITKELRDYDAVQMEYKVYLAEGRELEPHTLSLLKERFPAVFENIDSSNVWMLKAIEAHLKNLNELERLMGSSQKPSNSVVEVKTDVTTDWLNPFDEKETKLAQFFTEKNEKVDMAFMRTTGAFRTAVLEDLNAKVVEMPFKKDNVSLLIYLPEDKDGVNVLNDQLKEKSLHSIYSSMSKQEVDVLLPRFEDSNEMDLDKEIATIGLKYPLPKNTETESERPYGKFTTKLTMKENMNSNMGLEVNSMTRHDINLHREDGASYSSSTAAETDGRSLEGASMGCGECLQFYAAHPFIYHVVYNYDDQIVPIVMGCFQNLNININI
uniref:Serpin domain-containing protein n=1 Tax=Glossina brevipalpis TaxID=37001 RepID=A0A1A9WR86_9MUSC